MHNAFANTSAPDLLQPFLIDHSHIRGQLVRLGSAANAILARHQYPDVVSKLLAEMLVLASMLSSNLKSEGILTLQAKGDGPVKFVVVDATHDGSLRGYAELAEGSKEALAKLSRRKKPVSLKEILGKGYLAITLDQGPEGSRYQGIVELAGTSLSDAIQDYFTQSQQVEVGVKLAVAKDKTNQKTPWSAAGIMIERMPEEGGIPLDKQKAAEFNAAGEIDEDRAEQWRRNHLFMETVREEELLDLGLSSWVLLERLFNEDGVWAYPPKKLEDHCRCSRERVANILSTLPQEEVSSMMVDGVVSVNCQFCNTTQEFDGTAIAGIYAKG